MVNLSLVNSANSDPLPSWNEGIVKKSILTFIQKTTDQDSPNFVPVAERIAVFDFDGTIMPEKLMPCQSKFLMKYSVEDVKDLCKKTYKKAESAFSNLFSIHKAKVDQNLKELEEQLIIKNLADELLLVDNYRQKAAEWIETAKHPILKDLFGNLAYLPIQELIKHLKEHQFSVYIVSGSGEEFLRSIVPKIIDIPKENIFGTVIETKQIEIDGEEKLKFKGKIRAKNNNQEKVETIKSRILKKPIIAVGNSDGDKEMLLYALESKEKLAMIIHHTDKKREFKYGHLSLNGRLTEATRREVVENGGMVVGMKKNWKTVFSKDALKDNEIIIEPRA